MTLEDQVISLELAKRLKSLGVNQQSTFYWNGDYVTNSVVDKSLPSVYAAFTATELAKRYPIDAWLTVRQGSIKRKEIIFYFIFHHGEFKVSAMVKDSEGELQELIRFTDINEANARGLMYAYLIEQSIIEPNL